MSEQVRRKLKAAMQENARLAAEVERLRAASFVTAVPVEEYEKLKAQVERLTESRDRQVEINHELDDLCTRLKAEVERLTKAGDALANNIVWVELYRPLVAKWNAAKEGKGHE